MHLKTKIKENLKLKKTHQGKKINLIHVKQNLLSFQTQFKVFELSSDFGDISYGARDLFQFVSKERHKQRGKDCLLMIDNKGNYFKYVAFCTGFNLLTPNFMLPYIIMDLPIFETIRRNDPPFNVCLRI